ncbi:MAG: rhodanese-like domain-containing protein [bacterium]
MKVINRKDYDKKNGILIDVRHPLDYEKEKHHPDSRNIYYEKLMYNPEKYLNKASKYYLTCTRGFLSKKCIKTLEILGYDVTLVR